MQNELGTAALHAAVICLSFNPIVYAGCLSFVGTSRIVLHGEMRLDKTASSRLELGSHL
jgi:hypothetical protein